MAVVSEHEMIVQLTAAPDGIRSRPVIAGYRRGSELLREVAWVVFDEVHYMQVGWGGLGGGAARGTPPGERHPEHSASSQ